MVEIYDPEIIKTFYAEAASNSYLMIKLMVQVVVVLFSGIFLWKIGVLFTSKKNQQTRDSLISSSRYQKHWRKK